MHILSITWTATNIKRFAWTMLMALAVGLMAAVLVLPATVSAVADSEQLTRSGDSYETGAPTPEMRSLEAASSYSVSRCGNTGSRVLLSYDDWSYASPARMVRQAERLASKNVGAMFFPVRQEYIQYLNANGVNLATKVRDQGQWMGNHTWSHKNLTKLSRTAARTEIAKGAGGETGTSGYLRPPYGAYNASVKATAESMNYHVCTWTVDTKDYTGKTAAQICSYVKSNARAGSVVLMHLQTKAYDATNCIVDGLRAKGLSLCRPYKVNGQIAHTKIRAPYPLPC